MYVVSRQYRLTHHNFVLFAILWLGLFLRVYNLDYESIWLDEGVSILAHLTPIEIIEDRASNVHLVEDQNRVWLILSKYQDQQNLVRKTLLKDYNLSYSEGFTAKYGGPEVYLFVKTSNRNLTSQR